MKIEDGFEIDDKTSGLKLKVIKGIALDRLHIEHTGKPMVDNRDFFFTREGEFDGTGSAMDDLCKMAKKIPEKVFELCTCPTGHDGPSCPFHS